MGDPNYQRTSGSRNRINKRIFPAVPLIDGTVISSTARYAIRADGSRVRVDNKTGRANG